MNKYLCLSAKTLVLSVQCCFGQYGEIDTSFGNNGLVEIPLGISANSKIVDTKLDNNENIVSTGSSFNGSFAELLVLRLTPEGNPDNSFSEDGKATIAQFTTNTYGTCLVIDGQNRIIVAGHHNSFPDQNVFVARFLANGNPDSSFGDNGVLSIPIGSNNAFCNDIGLDNNNRIVIAGHVNFNSMGEDFFVMRFQENGNLDESFGTNGIVENVNDISSGAQANLAIQNDNKIIIAGSGGSAGIPNYCILRLNENGSLDTSFNEDGIVTTPIAGEYNSPYGIVLRPDGKIITGGLSGYWQFIDISCVQYDNTGSLDPDFGNNGIIVQQINGTTDIITDMILQPDGKLLTSIGTVGPDGTYDYFVMRLNVDGSTDDTFGNSGLVQIEFSNNDARAESLVLQSDGKIVVSGYSQTINTNYTAFVRLTSGLPVQVYEQNDKLSLDIFPNPTREYLNITQKQGQIQLVRFFDICGKELHVPCAKDDKSGWNVSSLKAGQYFIQIAIGDDFTCHSFMITE